MEVGNVNVPSILQQQTKAKELPEEKAEKPLMQILFDCNKVDPDQYIIGPDDRLSLYLFGELDRDWPLQVTAEGMVNIPTVGSVIIGDKTLTEAKELIRSEVNKKYRGIQVSVNLVQPRFFRVFVSGMVRNPGSVDTHALERVSDVIDRAGLAELERTQLIPGLANQPTTDIELLDPSYQAFLRRQSSQRTIVIHRGDKEIPVDLQRFRRFGLLEYNPYVSAGDRIQVPSYVGNLYVYGQVNEPGRFEFKPGDRILDLVQFAGGITSSADTTRATLTRFQSDGKKTINMDINLNDALFLNPDEPKYLLQESDRLSIWRKFDYKVVANVYVRGEVKYPGFYPIRPNETTLKEMIDMAGGLTENANLEEARLIRPSSTVQDMEYQRLSRMLVADMSDEEYDLFKNLSRARRGEISVDFVRLLKQNDTSDSTRLLDGDEITIPVTRNFVNVMGAVQQPGFMQIEAGKDANYYITKAGGFNFNAYKSKTRIIKARTGQRFRPSKQAAIEGGDTIHVPEKKPADLWSFAKDSALLFANVATIIILARQLSN
jgi:protein involved in polysaccharide export with SLBB domain